MSILNLIKLKIGIRKQLEKMKCAECGEKISVGRDNFCVTWTGGEAFHTDCYQARRKIKS